MTDVVLLCGDLMLQAKVMDIAKHLKVDVHLARNVEDAKTLIVRLEPALLLVDLGLEDPLKAIRAIKSDPKTKSTHLLCFGPHVERDLFAACKHAGANEVLPRSRFFIDLGEILGGVSH